MVKTVHAESCDIAREIFFFNLQDKVEVYHFRLKILMLNVKLRHLFIK